MQFEWDENKNLDNFKKHSIWFEEVQTIWADAHSLEYYDPDHSKGESRFIRLGFSTHSRLLLVVFCEREHGQTIRLISARKATTKEREQYEK